MLKDYILDLLFPHRCLSCSVFLAQENKSVICPRCLAGIVFKTGFACPFCSSPVSGGIICRYCKPGHFLDRLIVAASYDQPLVERMIKFLKYHFIKGLASDAGKSMIDYLVSRQAKLLTELLKPSRPMVTAVPLSRYRFNWRGFNQSELLAKEVAGYFGWQYQDRLLKRTGRSKPQTTVGNRGRRLANAVNAFKCLSPATVQRKTILLIDDVATTGATLDDCARALKGAGAKEVIGFVFARGG